MIYPTPISDLIPRLISIGITTKVYQLIRLYLTEEGDITVNSVNVCECLLSICWEAVILQLTKGPSQWKLRCCQFLLVLNIVIVFLSIQNKATTFVSSNTLHLIIQLLFLSWIVHELIFFHRVSKNPTDFDEEIMSSSIRLINSTDQCNENCLTETEVKEFFKGVPAIIFSEGQVVRPENIPFDKRLEISLPQLTINHECQYKDSFYGVGYKGLLRSHKTKGSVEVFIKKNKKNLNKEEFKRFLTELKTTILVKNHENVLGLIGACTKGISEGFAIFVYEDCKNNTLHEYLSRIRKDIQSLDPDVVTKHEMFRFAYEIASGMSFITNKKVIHGALSARKVLLTSGKTAKITEFGVYLGDIKDSFSWRNISIEGNADGQFSMKSDVYSYAITTWEIFTFAETPFSDFDELTPEFLDSIKNGTRPKIPEFESEISNVLESCWQLEPDDRPDFKDILTSMYKLTRPKRRTISFQL